jgi:regulatory protein
MPNKCIEKALALLTRREHSAYELLSKLGQKGYAHQDIDDAIAYCQTQGYQSDERFVSSFIHARQRQGFGPIKVKYELKARGVSDALIQDALDANEDWLAIAFRVWQKKFNGFVETNLKARAKQQRFLLNRGFSNELISNVMKEFDSEL